MSAPAVVELTGTDPMRRQVNAGLMIAWINADLVLRAAHDVRHSIVLYDDDRMFLGALPASVEITGGLLAALLCCDVRYYSRGIV